VKKNLSVLEKDKSGTTSLKTAFHSQAIEEKKETNYEVILPLFYSSHLSFRDEKSQHNGNNISKIME